MSKIKGITIEIGGNTVGLDKAISNVGKHSRDLQFELKKVEKLLKLDPTNTELLSQKQKLLAESVETTQVKLEALKEAEARVQSQFENGEISAEQYRKLQREIIDTEQNLKKLEQQTDEFNGSIKKSGENLDLFIKKSKKMGETSVSMGKKMLPMTAAITALGVASVKVGSDFDFAMSNVQSLSGATGDELQKLRDKAEEMGRVTSKSAKQSAEAMGYMALAGWDNKQIIAGIEPILRLSEAATLDLGKASDLVTDSMSAMSMSVEELGFYLDVVAKTQASANTSADQMLEAYVSVGGMFNNLNVPLEESASLIGILANRGIKGSQAGTALNATLINLTTGAGKAGKAMKELGLNAYNNKGEFKGIESTLNELNNALATCTAEQKDNYLAMIGGKNNVDTLNALLNGLNDEYTELKFKVSNASGSLEEMAKIKQDNLKGDLTALSSKMESVAITISKKLEPTIRKIIKKIGELVEKFGSLDDETLQTILSVVGLTAVIGPLLIIIGKTSIGISALAKTFKLLWGVMFANPIGALITAIGLLVASISLVAIELNKESESAKRSREEHERMIGAIKEENKAWDDMKISLEETKNYNLAEVDSTRLLWQELQTLVDINGNMIDTNKARAEFIMGELNTALGTELILTGNQIKGYKESIETIDTLIQTKKAQIILDSQEPLYKKAILEVNDKLYKQSELSLDISSKQAELESLVEARSYAKTIQGKKTIEDMKAQLVEKKATYDENEAIINDYYNTIATYEETAIAVTSRNYDQIKEINENFGRSFKRAGEVQDTELKKQIAIAKTTYDQLQEKVNSGVKGVTKVMVDEAQKNYEKAITEYEKTGNAVPDGLKAGIESKAPELLLATSNLIGGVKEWFTGVKGFDTHSPSKFTHTVGVNVMDGLLIGMQSSWNNVEGFVDEKVNWIKEKVNSAINFSDGKNSLYSMDNVKMQIPPIPNLSRGNIPPINNMNNEILQQSITVLSAMDRIKTGGESNIKSPKENSNKTVINQNVTINAPKAQSPSEIARQLRKSNMKLIQGV